MTKLNEELLRMLERLERGEGDRAHFLVSCELVDGFT